MKQVILILIGLFFAGNVWSQSEFHAYSNDPAWQPRQQDVDILNIKCEATIDGPKQYIDALATLTFRTFYHETDSICVMVAGLNVNSITIDGNLADYDLRAGEAIVRMPERLPFNTEHDLVIKYDANPYDGLYFTGWQENQQSVRKQIWAHSLQKWCPYVNIKHDLVTTEMIIQFDEKYKVFSNGPCISEKNNGDGTKTWHYKMTKPHVVYLACLMIGDFEVKKFTTDRGLPLEYLYYEDMADRFDVAYKYSKDMFTFYEAETGTLYPWELYRNMPAAEYLFGAMETTTSTIFGDYMYVDKRAWWMRNYVNVNSHELAHQWFGNYVSNINREIWLTESFATYYAKIFEKSVFGDDYYQWVRDKEFDAMYASAKKNNLPVAHSRSSSGRYYMKGSLVLDMMRDVLGDEGFKAAIKHYLADNAHKVVAYDDLLRAIREATGQSLEWFFDQWIMRGGEPHYKISYKAIKDKDNQVYTMVDVRQIHKTGNLVSYFKMPIAIQVFYKDGSSDIQKPWIAGAQTSVIIPNPYNKKIDFLVFDPGRHIPKNITFKRSIEELSAQAVKAENMIDRVLAIRAMKNIPLDKKIDAFTQAYKAGKFHLLRSAIIEQILADVNYAQTPKALDLIHQALSSEDELVVRAAVEFTDYAPKELQKNFEKVLSDSCYQNVELALGVLCRSFPKKMNKYLKQTEDEIGWRGRNIRLKWLEITVGTGNKKYLPELKKYGSSNYDFETRMRAFEALKTLNYCDDDVAELLCEASLYWHYKLYRVSNATIKYFYQQTQYKTIFDELLNSDTFDEAEKTKLRRIIR